LPPVHDRELLVIGGGPQPRRRTPASIRSAAASAQARMRQRPGRCRTRRRHCAPRGDELLHDLAERRRWQGRSNCRQHQPISPHAGSRSGCRRSREASGRLAAMSRIRWTCARSRRADNRQAPARNPRAGSNRDAARDGVMNGAAHPEAERDARSERLLSRGRIPEGEPDAAHRVEHEMLEHWDSRRPRSAARPCTAPAAVRGRASQALPPPPASPSSDR
jgi:hypothetical protein